MSYSCLPIDFVVWMVLNSVCRSEFDFGMIFVCLRTYFEF